tara:strand:+ start:100 stop:669 length:570 start_codon:yes stop_codon:yes gene_type:complete
MKYKLLPNHEIEYNGLTAKAVNPEDIEFIRKCRNSQKDILRQNKDIEADSQLLYFKQVVWPQLDLEKPNLILLSLFRDEQIIGYGGLVHISWENNRAEVSFLVSHQIRKDKDLYESTFNDFLCLIKKISFELLKLSRIYTETFDIRPLHISILEKNGFMLEGRLISHVIINKKDVDSLMHGCLRTNYEF